MELLFGSPRTKSGPPGQRFTGTIDAQGNMHLTDPSDGETWTTHEQPATSTFIEIEDFQTRPSPTNPDPALNIIRLSR